MSKNIEMEKRVMLSLAQYEELKKYASNFSNRVESLLVNHYFDTDDLALRNNHLMLRIRNINEKDYEVTLKVKGKNGDLEINKPVLKKEVDHLIKHFDFDNKAINKRILKVTDKEVKYLTSLKTERVEIQFEDYLFVLDKNYYSDVVDYNLEIEAHSIEDAKKYIKKYCDEFNMQYSKEYKSKSRRAINKALGL
ncbi:MAG: CYTH domain-containing protein [Bacilli bacterium]|nr:CYTH domain-containing protein [Bacilli bacterium]